MRRSLDEFLHWPRRHQHRIEQEPMVAIDVAPVLSEHHAWTDLANHGFQGSDDFGEGDGIEVLVGIAEQAHIRHPELFQCASGVRALLDRRPRGWWVIVGHVGVPAHVHRRGDARPYSKDSALLGCEMSLYDFPVFGSRAHDGHFSFENVPELGQLIDLRFA
jgi:hypothetical protein